MADMLTFSVLASRMLPDFPGCSAPVILWYLRRACTRFCADTEIWARDVEIDLVEDTGLYELTLDGAMVRRIRGVRFLDPAEDDVEDIFAGREINLRYIEIRRDPDRIYLNPRVVPGSAEDGHKMIVRVVYVPDVTATVLDTEFLTRWSDGIRSRAMYELYKLSKRPWASDVLAARALAEYESEVNKARFDSLHEHKQVDARMVAPSFL